MKTKTRILIALALVAAVIAAARILPLVTWMSDVIGWVRGAGSLGLLFYFLFYALGVVAFLPGSLLTLGAGFLYGPFLGTLLVSPASVAGATMAFLVGRFVARDWVARKITANPKFAAVDEAIGTRGFYIVLLLRLSPVFPFTLLNYTLGLTRVKLRDYALASFIGMLPGTFLYVYLGSLITNAAQLLSGHQPSGGAWGQAFLIIGLIATVAVTWLITRIARRALDRVLITSTRAIEIVKTAEPL
ncbi:MAG: TVP38/TMEM64 family protein [Candidatus Acidiferrales bacterium]